MLVERLDAPAASVPRKLVIGAQRLWNNVRVPPAGLRDPMIAHQAGLLVDAPSLFVAHDTMEVDLTGRYRPEDAALFARLWAPAALGPGDRSGDPPPARRRGLRGVDAAHDLWRRPFRDPLAAL